MNSKQFLGATLFLVLVLAGQSTAQTTVTSNITTNTTWSTSGSPYTLSTDISVTNGATLTIQGGVIVNVKSNAGLNIIGTAKLSASNTAFTNTGSSTGQVAFSDNASGTIANSTFNKVNIYCSGSGNPSFTGNAFADAGYPVWLNDGAAPPLSGNTFTGTTTQGIKLAGAIYRSWTLPNYGLPYFVDGDVYLNVDNARLKITDGNTLIFVGSSSFSTNRSGDSLQAQSVSFSSTGFGSPSVVFNDNCIGKLRNCVFTYVQVLCNGTSKDSITVCNFRGAVDCIVRNNSATVGIVGNNFLVATTNYGVKNLNTASVVVARNNYWGNATGPQHSSNPGGSGVKVTDAVDFAGWASVTAIAHGPAITGLPKDYALNQNYPNPFNPSTVIAFELPENCHASLKIFDVDGREVQTVFDDNKSAGRYEVRLNAGKLSSGVYYYRLAAGSRVLVRAMTVLK
jgi:hypothetical protein